MTPRSRLLPAAIALLCAVALAVVPASASAAAAPRPKRCDVAVLVGRAGAGTTVTALKVTRATCPRGIAVAKAFGACRLANGPSGRCVRRVAGGWACGEQRTNGPTQFSASATCRKDRATVALRYTQTLQ